MAVTTTSPGEVPYDVGKYDPTILGATGLQRFAGYIREEFLPELLGIRGRKIFKEMRENDPTIGAVLFAIEMLIRQVDWHVQKANDSTEAQKVADFFDQVIHDMSHTWEDHVSESMSMLPFGFCPMELCYKQRIGPDEDDPTKRSDFTDGKIGWRKLSIRAQETLLRWVFDDEGGLQGMIQIPPPDFKMRYIPIEKMLLYRTTNRKGNPEGRSILRNAYTSWYYVKHIQEIEAIGIERDLAGLPVMKVPLEVLMADSGTPSGNTRDAMEKTVTGIHRDEMEGVLIPSDVDPETKVPYYALELLSSAGQRQFNTDPVIQRKKQEIAGAMLADFILLGHENVGSFALSSDKTELFSLALSTWLDHIAVTTTHHGFKRLGRLNGIPSELIPTLHHGDVKSVDLDGLGAFIANLAKAGFPLFPNPELQAYVFEQAKLPVPKTGWPAPMASTLPTDGGGKATIPANPKKPQINQKNAVKPKPDTGKSSTSGSPAGP